MLSTLRHRLITPLVIALAFNFYCLRNIFHQPTTQHDAVAYSPHESDKSSYFPSDKDDDYEIVTTNYGWRGDNPPGPSRRKLTAEFFNAILSHPRYNSSAWRDLEEHPDPSRRVVAFLDIDTCMESNYPNYGVEWTHNNINLDIPAQPGERILRSARMNCKLIKRAAESPVLTANEHSRLIVLDCGTGHPGSRLKDLCEDNPSFKLQQKLGGGWGNVLDNEQVILGYYGIPRADARPNDIGLPAPAIKSVTLEPHERYSLQNCHNTSRDYMFSFQGGNNYGRERLRALDNGRDVYVRLKERSSYGTDINTTSSKLNDYADILRSSFFAGAPIGDCLWSYRFTEIMSAGAIPIMYANDWLPPFSSTADPDRIVNWTKCALFIGEGDRDVMGTMDVVRAIPEDVRCEMMKCSLAFWDEFASSREGWLKAILLWVNRERRIEVGNDV